MDITPLIKSNAKVIQGYGKNGIKVSGEYFKNAICVMPEEVLNWDAAPESIEKLEAQHLLSTLKNHRNSIDVVLVGTGKKSDFPNAQTIRDLKQAGIHAEFMDNGAACRTFNVLLAEGRQVAAALLAL